MFIYQPSLFKKLLELLLGSFVDCGGFYIQWQSKHSQQSSKTWKHTIQKFPASKFKYRNLIDCNLVQLRAND